MSASFRRHPDATFEVIDGQAMILGVDSRELVTLNASGTAVWEALQEPLTAEDLATVVAPTGADPGEISVWVMAFLEELLEADLVVTEPQA